MLLLKSIVYRVLRIILLFITSYIMLDSIETAISISLVDAVIATIYYYYFDKIWETVEIKIKHFLLSIKYRKFK